MGPCPRCQSPLAEGAGALAEDVCASCGGRALSNAHTRKLFEEELGLSPATLKELAQHFAGERLTCPSCSSAMSRIRVRGASVDVCLGCGTAFFDDGELARLSGGAHREVVPPRMSSRGAAIAEHLRAPDVKDPELTHYPVVAYATERAHDPSAEPMPLWERSLPMAMIEGALLYAWFFLKGISFGKGSPLDTYFSAFGLVSIPLLLSVFVDADLRSFFPKGGKFRLSIGVKGHVAGALSYVAAFVGIAIGGAFSTTNAMLAEKFPRLLNMKTAAIAAGSTLLLAIAQTIFG